VSDLPLDSIRSPISPEAPTGRDVRYDEDFLALKSEVAKQGTVSAATDYEALVQQGRALTGGRGAEGTSAAVLVEAGGPDFAQVVELATRILTSASKDLQVASFLCFGLLRTRGYAGLADGLEACRLLVEGYWEKLFPERANGRRQAVQWLAERGAEALPGVPAGPGDREPLERAIATCRVLDGMLQERMPEEPPSLSALTRGLTEVLGALPAVAPPPGVAGPAAAAVPAGAPAPSAPAAAPVSAAPGSDDDALLAVTRAADFLRASLPASPIAYRLLRAARWDVLEGLPFQESGKTMLPPPEEHHRTRLEGAGRSGNARELLAACDELFYESPNQYWLDLQRAADQALGALGPEYGAARKALRRDLAGLLERLPGLEGLAFSDGTPFADAATREWLDREIRPLLGGGARAAAAPAAPGDAALEAELEEARGLADGGDLAGALEKLHAAQAAERVGRTRFLRQLGMARLLVGQGRAAVARSLLEELDERIERQGLSQWDPELCVQVWSQLQRVYQSLMQSASETSKEDYQNRIDRVFDRICRLDVRLALSEGSRA